MRKELGAVFPIEGATLAFRCSTTDDLLAGSNPRTKRKFVHSAEVVGLVKIASALAKIGVTLDASHFYGMPESPRLLLIGSEKNNPRDLYSRGGLGPYVLAHNKGRHASFVHKETQQEFRCQDEDEGFVRRDYGVIFRKSHLGQTRVLLAGIHMHGTLGAIEVALQREFQRRVLDHKYSSFVQLVEVHVARDGYSVPPEQIIWKSEWFHAVEN